MAASLVTSSGFLSLTGSVPVRDTLFRAEHKKKRVLQFSASDGGGTFISQAGDATHDDHRHGVVDPRSSARASHRPCLSILSMILLQARVVVVGRVKKGLSVLRAPQVTLREDFEIVTALAHGLQATAHGSSAPDSGGWYCLAMRSSKLV
jgi:hypothetical protein